jgi:hypothetical protein
MMSCWEQPTWVHALGYVASELKGAAEPDFDFE